MKIECVCGIVIKPKKGAVQVNCRCGRVYRLCKDGKPVILAKEEK